MILEELYLHNFCLYKGMHRFALAPITANGLNCPITLFGGMNGAGKTTILDAVQLALYGPRARTANRLGKPYDDYLRECVHRGAVPIEGTSVSVKFTYHAEGQQHSYEVWRGWSLGDKAVRERVRVTKDDVTDSFLSEHWNDVVEELIPIGVSQLFFFDAEKVRFLADDETDTVALGTAIKSLLGLDLAERLIADAAVVERRLSDEVLDQSNDERVQQLQSALEGKSADLTTAKSERAAIENPLLRARAQLEKAKTHFSSAGGDHWSRRSEKQAELRSTEEKIGEIQTSLREFAAGELPLTLVSDVLDAVAARDSVEVESANAIAFNAALTARDRKILKDARNKKLTQAALQTVKSLLDADRKSRLQCAASQSILELSGQARSALGRLTTMGCEEHRRASKKALSKLKTLEATRDKCIRALNATPDDEVIASLVEKLRTCAETVGTFEGDARRLNERIEVLRRERDGIDEALTVIRKELVNKHIEHAEAIRMAKLAQRTQFTMREFLRKATAHKIERLSDLVTKAFLHLLHKHTLVTRVQIHPDTFRIDLYDDADRPLPKTRLSEGEKQIFAVAVLWGLAQASPRQLPSIIDTPMARLDSDHRQHLVERYFPNASHQVIILSTDTEIEQAYFEQLRSRIARSYHLSYNNDERCTVVSAGYFWNEQPPSIEQEVTS